MPRVCYQGTRAALAVSVWPGLHLYRTLDRRWVTSRWEDVDPRAEKRPARRYDRLTAGGAVQASAALAGARRPTGTALRRLAEEGGTT